MKQTKQEVIEKIKSEYNALAEKIGALERFMLCDDFTSLSNVQKGLLEEQHTLMSRYKNILLARVRALRTEDGEQR